MLQIKQVDKKANRADEKSVRKKIVRSPEEISPAGINIWNPGHNTLLLKITLLYAIKGRIMK